MRARANGSAVGSHFNNRYDASHQASSCVWTEAYLGHTLFQ